MINIGNNNKIVNSSIIQINDRLIINGEEIEQPKSLFFKKNRLKFVNTIFLSIFAPAIKQTRFASSVGRAQHF